MIVQDEHSELTLVNVFFASCFIGLGILVARVTSHSLAWSMLVAAVRCFLQLQFLAFFLGSVFQSKSQFAVCCTAAILFLLGSWEICFRRAKRRVPGLLPCVVLSLSVTAVPMSYLASRMVLSNVPWWRPVNFVPLFGMMIGNNISAMSVGISHALETVYKNQDKCETLIAYGATPFEICKYFIPDTMQLALLPMISQMSIVGLITIPGTLAGAILAGDSIEQAARLQNNLLFVCNGTSAISTALSVALTYLLLFDEQGRLRIDRIENPASKSTSNNLIHSASETVRRLVRFPWTRRRQDVFLG